MMRQRRFLTAMFAACMTVPAAAQQFVYPAKGQSPDQQRKDEAACYSWAVQQTGFDPAKSPPAGGSAPTTATGVTPGAGLRGAARGAIVGEVAGGRGGEGAVAGAIAARGASRQANQANQQHQAAVSQEKRTMFGKARAACLEGRGYTVK